MANISILVISIFICLTLLNTLDLGVATTNKDKILARNKIAIYFVAAGVTTVISVLIDTHF